MIDNNVDRMSVVNILPFSLDRIVRSLEDQSVDGSLLHLQPDQPGSVGHRVFVAYGPNPDFFCVNFFKSNIR